MALITYANKATMNQNSSVPDVNKVKADDMNEIKSVVNTNWNIKQIATYGLSANASMTTNSTVTIIPFNNLQSATSNSGFTLGNFTTTVGSGVGVVVPAGVSKIKVSSNVKFDNSSNVTMDFVNYMWKYNSSDGTALTLTRTYSPSVAGGKSTGCVASPILVDVVPGDMIFIRAYKSSSASGSTAVIGGGTSQTYITVESVE